MKKHRPVIKAILVLIVMTVLGYFGLNVPQGYVEEVIDEQFAVSESVSFDSSQAEALLYPVLSVIDGDTIVVSIGGQKQTVRVLGIDAPETEYSPQGAECYEKEAAAKARELLANSQVFLQADTSQAKMDVYDRLLAYVITSEGEDFGEVMVRSGFAKEFTYKGSAYKNQSLYQAAEAEAREQDLGVWGCLDE